MTLIASDGYEYTDLTQRLLGQPRQNARNGNVRSYRQSKYGEEAIRAYYEAFDRQEVIDPEPGNNDFAQRHRAGLDAAKATLKFGPPHTWPRAFL